jgi:mutator family transposase
VGIAVTGERDVLAFRVGDRENEQAWKDLFDDLKARGVKEIGLWVSDGNQAMLNAITAKFGSAPRQRCVMHKMDNVRKPRPKQTAETDQTRIESFVLVIWIVKPLIRPWQPSLRNTRRSIQVLSSAYSVIWRPVWLSMPFAMKRVVCSSSMPSFAV